MSFFGINASEFLILVVLAVIFFGPERIPEFSRKAARVVFYVRNIANGATQQLKDELGPEYQDLTLDDLNPKNFVQKHLLDDIQADLDGIKSDLDDVRREVNSATNAATSATSTMNQAVRDAGPRKPAAGQPRASHAAQAGAPEDAPAQQPAAAAVAAAATGQATATALDAAVSAMKARYGLCFDLDAT
ncbi:sec-independent translocase [Propionibacterium australiense]|uniref:Bacterial sec-independent translocation TatB protein signature n=1 Tax=Propionibacterium australiense TaxID=119981 RepID=A0A383S6I4_9ACTN|nr:sec-independent translocase [Propionibacterium australiense]SYZ33527.1 Bacterial sec-independent translocation TatB protein signature [Propionibacterium australiense]VEH89638.1 Sec-independent protein translocase protein TatB [Propionibacterium australiense]